MDTEGPVSVLDRRTKASSRDKVIADRITRQRSPGPSFRHQRGRRVPSLDGSFSEDEQHDVIYRISQPYRTSFSAKHSVTWGKADRSRSLSPTSSLRSDASYASAPPIYYSGGDKKRPRGRSKSPKRVTYNNRVTVRHSDTEDSMFTELSSHEDTPLRPIVSPFSRALISPRYNEFSQLSPVSLNQSRASPPDQRPKVRDVTNVRYRPGETGELSTDSGLDYSTELKDLSDQITRMQWSPRQNRATHTRPPQIPYIIHQPNLSTRPPHGPPKSGKISPPGILKDSQNSRSSLRENPFPVMANGSINGGVYPVSQPHGTSPTSASNGSLSRINKGKENDPRVSPEKSAVTDFIARDYEHERPFNYSAALKGDYGEDISKLAQEVLLDVQQTDLTNEKGSTENGGLNLLNTSDPQLANNDPIIVNNIGQHDVPSSSPADTSQGETSPGVKKLKRGRGSPVESGRLTPSKRSYSLSITNFLKRVSPNFGRKRSKERATKTRSAEGSAQSLNNTTSDTDRDSPTNTLSDKPKKSGKFSRSQVRQSFMKLVGRSGSK